MNQNLTLSFSTQMKRPGCRTWQTQYNSHSVWWKLSFANQLIWQISHSSVLYEVLSISTRSTGAGYFPSTVIDNEKWNTKSENIQLRHLPCLPCIEGLQEIRGSWSVRRSRRTRLCVVLCRLLIVLINQETNIQKYFNECSCLSRLFAFWILFESF